MSLTTTNGSTALATTGGGNPFLDAAESMGASSGALVLRFDGNTGAFSYGKDREAIDKGTRMAVNPNEFRLGWICWSDGKVLEQRMTRIVDGKPPARSELTDHGIEEVDGDGWREQASATFRDIESGDEFRLDISSKGGRIALGNLVRDYGKAFSAHPGELAIVELGNVSFDAKDPKTGKKVGRKHAPAFKIVAWMNEAELVAKFDAASAHAEEEPEPEVPVNTGRRSRNFG